MYVLYGLGGCSRFCEPMLQIGGCCILTLDSVFFLTFAKWMRLNDGPHHHSSCSTNAITIYSITNYVFFGS